MEEVKDKVRYGVDKFHYALVTKDDETGIEYGPITPVNGAVSISSESTYTVIEVMADNGTYYKVRKLVKITGELEVVLVGDDILEKIFGAKKDENGAIIEMAGDKTARIAFLGEIEGDKMKRRIVLYNVELEKPSESYETISDDNVKITNSKMKFVALPIKKNGTIRASLPYSEKAKEPFNKFFNEVYTAKFPEA